MALLLKNDKIFIHTPKTGGTWLREVLYNLDLVVKELDDHAYLDALGEYTHCPKFAFVRNPLTWYQSLWCMYKDDKRAVKIPFAEYMYSYEGEDFNGFVNDILDTHPSFLYGFMKRFLGENLDTVDYIGQLENLDGDFISIMNLLGYDIDLEVVYNTMMRNKSRIPKPNYNDVTKQRVIAEEIKIFNKFKYSTEI